MNEHIQKNKVVLSKATNVGKYEEEWVSSRDIDMKLVDERDMFPGPNTVFAFCYWSAGCHHDLVNV